MSTATITTEITLKTTTCAACGVVFAMPDYLMDKRRNDKETFYCPNGHSLSFTKPEHERKAERLEKEKLELRQENERLANMYLDEMNKATKLTRDLKRLQKGVCSCCKRSFINLKRHMETKHPELLKEEKNESKSIRQ